MWVADGTRTREGIMLCGMEEIELEINHLCHNCQIHDDLFAMDPYLYCTSP